MIACFFHGSPCMPPWPPKKMFTGQHLRVFHHYYYRAHTTSVLGGVIIAYLTSVVNLFRHFSFLSGHFWALFCWQVTYFIPFRSPFGEIPWDFLPFSCRFALLAMIPTPPDYEQNRPENLLFPSICGLCIFAPKIENRACAPGASPCLPVYSLALGGFFA